MHAAYQAKEAHTKLGPLPRQDASYAINTYFHVIQDDDAQEGYVSASQISDQVLSSVFVLVCPKLLRVRFHL
jgi:hypothetical protein